MSARGSQFCIGKIAVGPLGEASMPEGGKGKLQANASLCNYLLHNAAQIAQVLAWCNPWKRDCRAPMGMGTPEYQARERSLLNLIELGRKFRKKRDASFVKQWPPSLFSVLRMHNP